MFNKSYAYMGNWRELRIYATVTACDSGIERPSFYGGTVAAGLIADGELLSWSGLCNGQYNPTERQLGTKEMVGCPSEEWFRMCFGTLVFDKIVPDAVTLTLNGHTATLSTGRSIELSGLPLGYAKAGLYIELTDLSDTSPIYIQVDEKASNNERLFMKSRLWGDPDWPVDSNSLPTALTDYGQEYQLTFVAQLNLAEVAHANDHTPLPRQGMLYFFANIEYFLHKHTSGINAEDWDAPNGELWPENAVRVVYSPSADEANYRTLVLVDADNESQRVNLDPHPISFSSQKAVKTVHSKTIYADLHLFGLPDDQPWEDWPEPCRGWSLLLQLDSMECADFTLQMTDEGYLYFLISPEDLALANFNNVRAVHLAY